MPTDEWCPYLNIFLPGSNVLEILYFCIWTILLHLGQCNLYWENLSFWLNLSLIENLSLTKVGSSPGCSSLDLWSNALTSRFWDQVQDALAWICGVMPWLPRSEKQYLDSSSCRNRDWTLGTVGKKVTFIHAPASYEYFKLCFRSCSSFHLPKNIWYSRKFSSVKCWKTWPPEPFCSNFSCTLSFMGKGGLY